jgi:2,5-furandicarboxylate decarboxylase 1
MNNDSADFRSFLWKLQSENDLVRIKRDVNAEYELAAVTARLDCKQAVLFEKVCGSKMRVACDVVATPRRFYLALGEGSHKTSEADVKKGMHTRVTEGVRTLSEAARIQHRAVFEENSSRNLNDLHIVTHFEKDA